MLLERMVAGKSVCLRRLSQGERAREVQFHRFLGSARVTPERLVAGWSEGTLASVQGRHVLAIQDTSEVQFSTTTQRRRGLGEIGKGNSHGLLLHPVLAVDADSGDCLGLLSGKLWTRQGRRDVPHDRREPSHRESQRWTEAALAAKALLGEAAMVTFIGDRENDIFAFYAEVTDERCHAIVRSMHDRLLVGGIGLYATTDGLPVADRRAVVLPQRGQRPKRTARLELRFGALHLARPRTSFLRRLPKSLPLNVVDVREVETTVGSEPLHWRLLTTHRVANAHDAWGIVERYRQRWMIEQFFRVLKTQGFQIEDSQIATADRLLKLVAIAAKAAVLTMQLMQARDGRRQQPLGLTFQPGQVAVLHALNHRLEARSKRLKNPHPPDSLAWVAWIIARLGGWNGYPSSKPPGPITFKHGLEYFFPLAVGWTLRDVCIP